MLVKRYLRNEMHLWFFFIVFFYSLISAMNFHYVELHTKLKVCRAHIELENFSFSVLAFYDEKSD